jgi:hypothetical protein
VLLHISISPSIFLEEAVSIKATAAQAKAAVADAAAKSKGLALVSVKAADAAKKASVNLAAADKAFGEARTFGAMFSFSYFSRKKQTEQQVTEAKIAHAKALTRQGIADQDLIAAKSVEQTLIATQAAADAAVIAAEPLTAGEARKLGRKRKRSPAEQAQLARYRIAATWGLGATDPTPAIIEAHREGLSRRARMGWILRNLEGRQLVAKHDHAVARALAPNRRHWAPDLCRETIGPKVTAAEALGLPSWLERGEWFTATEAQLLELQATATAHGGGLLQVLGVGPGKRATTTLRGLLALAGHRLEAKRNREDGDRAWRYRVVPEALPNGVDPGRLVMAWRDQLTKPLGEP